MMQLLRLSTALGHDPYPGRGIIVGQSACGTYAVMAYFIMGRSENSRNRIFSPTEDGIRTEAFDPAKLVDPSLIIYRPVRALGDITIVTNGDQTDTIYEALCAGKSFEDALRTRTFEPDAPNYTPRISALVERSGDSFAFRMSILKSAEGRGEACERFFFDYPTPIPGEGRFLHTYRCDGDPLPSFEGEPERVALTGTLDELTDEIWQALDPDNRVALFVRTIRLADGQTQTRIVNRHGSKD